VFESGSEVTEGGACRTVEASVHSESHTPRGVFLYAPVVSPEHLCHQVFEHGDRHAGWVLLVGDGDAAHAFPGHERVAKLAWRRDGDTSEKGTRVRLLGLSGSRQDVRSLSATFTYLRTRHNGHPQEAVSLACEWQNSRTP
jgi:hypothetical protein